MIETESENESKFLRMRLAEHATEEISDHNSMHTKNSKASLFNSWRLCNFLYGHIDQCEFMFSLEKFIAMEILCALVLLAGLEDIFQLSIISEENVIDDFINHKLCCYYSIGTTNNLLIMYKNSYSVDRRYNLVEWYGSPNLLLNYTNVDKK